MYTYHISFKLKPTSRTAKKQKRINPTPWLDLSVICMDMCARLAAMRSHASRYPLFFSGLQHPDTCSPCLFWFKGTLAEFSSLQVGEYGYRSVGIGACKNQEGSNYITRLFRPFLLNFIFIFNMWFCCVHKSIGLVPYKYTVIWESYRYIYIYMCIHALPCHTLKTWGRRF